MWHPDGSVVTASYDAAGHTVVNSDGTTTVTTYDPLWRVSTEKV